MAFKGICLVATVLAASNFGSCFESRGYRPLKDTLGNEVPFHTVVRDDFEYTVVTFEPDLSAEPEWQRLSDEYWPRKDSKKRLITTAGNKLVDPVFVNPPYLPREYDDEPEFLMRLCEKLRVTRSLCCAAKCPYVDGEPVFMEGRVRLYTALIEYVNTEYRSVGFTEIMVAAENFGCKCSTETEVDHQKIENCPVPNHEQESEGYFCDAIESPKAHKKCLGELPDWAKKSLKPIE